MTSDNSKVIASAMQSKKHSTKKLTTSEFIARAKTIHGDRYSYLKVVYKVGITCRTVQKRYPNKRAMPYQYEINKIVSGDAEFIWHLEKRITRLLRKYKYKPEIDFAGKTECYSVVTKPILKLLDEFNSAKQIQLLA